MIKCFVHVRRMSGVLSVHKPGLTTASRTAKVYLLNTLLGASKTGVSGLISGAVSDQMKSQLW